MAEGTSNPSSYIMPLNMNGLQGRMLRMPPSRPKKNREILFIYGHHASIERFFGLAEALSDYGTVTIPDLPGFGGMDSFYKIGKEPTLDTFADYLAAFVKMQYKRRKVTIIGYSLGFVIATRMLQRYPELTNKVDLIVSAVGFTHHDEFAFTKIRHAAYLYTSKFFTLHWPAVFFRNVILHPPLLRAFYHRTHNAKVKFEALSPEEKSAATEFEIHLWRINDVRTYMATAAAFLTLDNCQVQVKMPVVHIAVDADHYFDNKVIEQHLKVIFTDCKIIKSKADNHSMTVVANKEEAKKFMPLALQRMLNKPV